MVPQNFFSALRASVWSKNKGGRGRAPHWIRCCISLFISPRNRLGCTDWAAAPGNEVDRWYIIILINLRIDYLFPASPKYGKSVCYEVIAEEMEPTRKKAKYFEWIRSIINFRLSVTVELHCYKRNIFIAHFFSHVDSTFNITTVSVIAMVVFCAICLGIIVYLKLKPARRPKEYLPPDPDRETYI